MIEAKNISKKYKIPHEKKLTLFETLFAYATNRMTYEPFHALRDVSFQIRKGEVVGLIGKNGSGKTTLLKILGNVISPTTGTVHTKGTVAPFLSLGVGFHHELSAQENLYLYGAILGIRRKDIERNMNRILSFAGVERFKNMKLKNFSSGMIGRLAFALMIQTDSDIFLLDEIFATGDKDFVPRSLSVLEAYKREGKTIVLATHDLDLIRQYADRVILLHEGRVRNFGDTDAVLKEYSAI